LRVFGNVLRKIFGPERDEVGVGVGEWRRLHDIVRVIRSEEMK
jgi:hypothetical protein